MIKANKQNYTIKKTLIDQDETDKLRELIDFSDNYNNRRIIKLLPWFLFSSFTSKL